MHPALERYLDRVLACADLAPRDTRAVREEIATHLAFLGHAHVVAGRTDQEIETMLESEFGDPEELGRAIASAKGRFRTYVKKRARGTLVSLGAALVLAFVIRAQVAEVFRMRSDDMAPVVPNGALVLVNKWAGVEGGDVVVCRGDDGRAYVARVEHVGASSLTVTRECSAATETASTAGAWPRSVGRDGVIGRVWLVAR